MIISEEQITEFQRIYKEVKGKDISREDAYDQEMKLIRMVKVIYYDISQEEHQTVQGMIRFKSYMKRIREQRDTLQQ